MRCRDLLTGHGGCADRGRGGQAARLVEKPFSNNALVDRIEEALKVSAAAFSRPLRGAPARLDELTEREREPCAWSRGAFKLIATALENAHGRTAPVARVG
jgi:two-component system response regulator DctR